MGKRWNEDELNYLEEKWGQTSIPKIAKNLNRTIPAIKLKANQLGLGNHRYSRAEIPANQLFNALGYSYTPPNLKRFKNLGLKIIIKATIEKKYYFINLEYFWKWAEKNKKALNFARFEEGALGQEPDWVDEKRKSDRLNPAKCNVNRKWTNSETQLLIQKTKNGNYTYFELAKEFNRTESAIKKRLIKIKVNYRPIQQDPMPWSNEDEKKLLDLFNKGYDKKSIAVVLNRSQLSIEGKLYKKGIRG